MAVKVAIVHDALPFYGGAERTLRAMLSVFPDAPVYTLMHNRDRLRGTPLEQADVRPSWLDRMPGVHRDHYRFFPLFPAALRSFDLRAYDIVIASHYAAANWLPPAAGQVRLVYVHTPLRFLWQDAGRFRDRQPFLLRPAAALGQAWLRRLDRKAAARVDRLAANSEHIAGLVQAAWGRAADVIHPPVELSRFDLPERPRSGFVCVARLARHKRIEVVIEAFTRSGRPLDVIGEGPERSRLEALAGPGIAFHGWQPDAAVAERLAGARAFVHMAAEDFGIAMVEAQAAGCPVIAYRGGANPETVRDGVTGLLVDEQTPEALEAALDRFELVEDSFDPAALRRHAAQFGEERFTEAFRRFIFQ